MSRNSLLLFGSLVLIVLIAGAGIAISARNKPAETDMTQSKEEVKAKTYTQAPEALLKAEIEGKRARIKTEKGDIVFEFFTDAPLAASNFIFLASDGFYDGVIFHRREEGFVIQGGDPLGTGVGGPGYTFPDEPVARSYGRGIVAMANSGPDTNGSQFFIMLADSSLPPQYTIFGRVVEGMDIVDAIQVGDVMTQVTIE